MWAVESLREFEERYWGVQDVILAGGHEAAAWVSRLNGYDKQYSSFFIQTCLVAVPRSTLKTHWWKLLENSRFVLFEILKHGEQLNKVVLIGQVGYNGPAEFRRLMLVHAHGLGWVQRQSAMINESPLTFFFQPFSKCVIWMRDWTTGQRIIQQKLVCRLWFLYDLS